MIPFHLNSSFARGGFAAFIIGLAWSTAGAAPPPSPRTAAEIERALSIPGTTQPVPRLRGAPAPAGPGGWKLRGPAAIVNDPTPSFSPPSIDTLDYPSLIQDRPKVAALIHFDSNSARIRGDAYPLLDEYVDALKSPGLADAVLVIAGHTDSVGSDARNLRLSQERAWAVRAYLIAHGVGSNHLIAKGYGEVYPVASNATEAGRELNRRSEFIRVDGSTMVK